eukprot:jgi/Tetstr1/426871/TSEL_017085.t1
MLEPAQSGRVEAKSASGEDNYLAVYREKGRAGRRGPDHLLAWLLPVPEHPRVARHMHHFIDNVKSTPMVFVALAETKF